MHILQCTQFCSLPSSATPITPPSHCYGCTNYTPPSFIHLSYCYGCTTFFISSRISSSLLLWTITLFHPSFSCFSSTLLQMHKLHFSISLLLIFVVVSCSRILSPLSNKRKQEVRQLNICLLAMLLAFSSKQSTEHVLASFVASYVCSSSAHTRLTDQGKNNRV